MRKKRKVQMKNEKDINESSNLNKKSKNAPCLISDSTFSLTSSSSSCNTSTKSASSNSLKNLRLVPASHRTSFLSTSTGNTSALRAYRTTDTDENDDQYFQFFPTTFVPDDSGLYFAPDGHKCKRKIGSNKKKSSLDHKSYSLKQKLEREWGYLEEKKKIKYVYKQEQKYCQLFE